MTVCPPACRRRCIGGLCVCCIVCAGIWQINRNSAVKPCKRFWRFDRINLHGRQKSRCKRLRVADTLPGKRKALHPQQMQGKRKTPPGYGGVKSEIVSALIAPNIIICCRHDGITAANLNDNAVTGANLARIVAGGIQSSHCVISLVSHNISPPLFGRLEQRRKKPKEKQKCG